MNLLHCPRFGTIHHSWSHHCFVHFSFHLSLPVHPCCSHSMSQLTIHFFLSTIDPRYLNLSTTFSSSPSRCTLCPSSIPKSSCTVFIPLFSKAFFHFSNSISISSFITFYLNIIKFNRLNFYIVILSFLIF
uniref:Uncharacterized protein n=1 Tax=Cacopsylla melanoneura TaxID=428564 RepID=A0A8D8REA7_9HEMI